MSETIKVGMADLKICKAPDCLTTIGLGSCVGIALHDSVTKVTGLAHIMLPSSKEIRNNANKAKFADTGIAELIRLMEAAGASRSRITAKIAGGACMFAFTMAVSKDDNRNVGEKNIASVKKVLSELRIPILAEDVGLNYGRTVIIDSNTGLLTIKAVGKPVKQI